MGKNLMPIRLNDAEIEKDFFCSIKNCITHGLHTYQFV
jgi:hypothetical protein